MNGLTETNLALFKSTNGGSNWDVISGTSDNDGQDNIIFSAIDSFDEYTIAQPFSGAGTSGTPYQISAIDELRYLSENSAYWGDYFIQTKHRCFFHFQLE